MNARTEPQIIHHDGKPMYAVIPYDEYTALLRKAEEMEDRRPDEEVTLPHEVVKRSTLGGVSLVRAWREYLGLSQKEVASRMGISQPSFAKMEATETKNRPATLKKIAEAMGIQWEQVEGGKQQGRRCQSN